MSDSPQELRSSWASNCRVRIPFPIPGKRKAKEQGPVKALPQPLRRQRIEDNVGRWAGRSFADCLVGHFGTATCAVNSSSEDDTANTYSHTCSNGGFPQIEGFAVSAFYIRACGALSYFDVDGVVVCPRILLDFAHTALRNGLDISVFVY